MFAVAFDLVVADTAQHHPKGVSQAYADIGSTLATLWSPTPRNIIPTACPRPTPTSAVHWRPYGFDRVQGSLYTNASEDLANLFAAITALKALPWLPASVRDIRAFRVEQWSDFTKLVKS